ncbi:hypothetical protein LOD99_10593 [Oopsacas minuta]|uniref:Uncharacterized protein n=1 Tax=Oopsacas minuta TaxID=111878 RepID=A0AAV7KI52_9METZ|nr:hypothetical protein LOD99_10593 [Oopsacas minuta]
MATHINPKQVILSPSHIKETESCSVMSLPRSLHETYKLHLKRTNHPAIKLFASSLQAHRSCNEAILFLYGVSGAGKSSTLNHLFSTDLIPTSATESATDSVTEWVSSMHSEHWRVSNLEVGFVDVPGWGDSEGRDATNFALMEQFLTVHPILGSKLRKFYPNVVLLVFNSNDNRILGSEANALRMLRTLSKLNIVDKKRPNVVIVLTHVCSHSKIEFSEKLSKQSLIYQNIARSCLGVNPPVVLMENNPTYQLTVQGDWTLLYDDTEQPLNLYKAIRDLMVSAGDEVGKEAIRLYFDSRVKNQPKERLRINSNCLDIHSHAKSTKKWVEVLRSEIRNHTNTELNLFILQFVKENPILGICTENISGLLLALELCGIHTIAELSSLTIIQLEIKITPFLLSVKEKLVLFKSSLIKSLVLSDSISAIGCGYNIESEDLSAASIFDWSQNEAFNPFLLTFLSQAITVSPIEGSRFTYGTVDRSSAAPQQLKEAIEQLDKCLFHNSLQDSRTLAVQLLEDKFNELSELFFRVEFSKVCLKLNLEFVRFNSEFTTAIKSLPHQCINEVNNQLIPVYTKFFKQYGHFVMLQANGGGLIEGRYTITNEDTSSLRTIHMVIELYFDLIQEGYQWKNLTSELALEERQIMEKLDKTSLVWLAGDMSATAETMEGLNRETYSIWLESLAETFILFDSSVSFVPIYLLADHIDKIVGEELKMAFELTHPQGKRLFSEHCLDLDSIGSSFQVNDTPIDSTVNEIRSVPEAFKRFKLKSKHKI